ncbi:uncharacterized protein BO95DRAFT_439301 [Aspergillus brunneoviolaceus CBS 621.78]|uniref:Uncharacterized protein n=1 Tax=Aspergillus brunneoviolaceus CBS 621.78 TaxID=1450534 RepID=A0ACD1GKE5_9EURO|nr:hypothetical protein BO95DRAFT_439301 [Aspergillus brunneoviolaceus CBS 621.78]RAH49697.1 hypothetical protein BO95DRAFT_439301 [Aspergillus brunneoviolaceus CBS 621.78]
MTGCLFAHLLAFPQARFDPVGEARTASTRATLSFDTLLACMSHLEIIMTLRPHSPGVPLPAKRLTGSRIVCLPLAPWSSS